MKKVKGFTLIELLIVIAIIGILAVAFLPSLFGALSKGNDAQRLASVQKVENFLVTQILARAVLPASGCIQTDAGVGLSITANLADFGGVFPIDPDPANPTPGCVGKLAYVQFAAGGAYTAGVYVAVENKSNANFVCPDAPATLGAVVNPALLTPAQVAAANAAGPWCYLALVQ